MSIRNLTSTLRKNKRRGKLTTFDDDDSRSIYSTLSKKPADLETTDIDLSAIRILLGDGSHRTLSSTPSTTCGEILDKLLDKLGLSEQRDEYGLQIQYKLAEPRVPDDREMISQLNVHVWDSVDKIYLYKKSGTYSMIPNRKRVASYSQPTRQNSDANLYENCAVSFGYRESDFAKCQLQPVLVNDALASGFAKAWSSGADLSESKEKEQATTGENAEDLNSEQSYNSYTLDRGQRRKNNTLRRQKPINSNSNTVSSRWSPASARKSSVTSQLSNVQRSPTNNQKGVAKNHFRLPLSSSDSPRWISRSSSQESPSSSPGIVVTNCELPTEMGTSLILNPLHKRSQSEGCIISAIDTEEKLTVSCTELLRDSGFHDGSISSSTSQCRLSQLGTRQRKTSISLENIPHEATEVKYHHSQSAPSVAIHRMKTRSNDESDDVFNSNVNASSLKSYKSMELLTGEDFDTIESNLRVEDSVHTPDGAQFNQFFPPPVPKRDSSCLDNCSVPDDYLLKQGKRLSHVLNLNATIKPEERSPFRSLFEKVGTILSRKKKYSSSLSTSTVSTLSPTCTSPGQTVYPNTPPSIGSPVDHCPFPSESSTLQRNSRAMRMKKQFSLESYYSLPDSPLLTPDYASQSPINGSHNECFDVAIKQPNRRFVVEAASTTQSLDRLKNFGRRKLYDVAVPVPLQARSPTPEYLQVLSPLSTSMPSRYENCGMEDQDDASFYQTPPPQQVKKSDRVATVDTKMYENHHIKGGTNGAVTLDGSMLHDYQVPPSTITGSNKMALASTKDKEIYENTHIQSAANEAITFNGSIIHDYQTPQCIVGRQTSKPQLMYETVNTQPLESDPLIQSPPPIPPHVPNANKADKLNGSQRPRIQNLKKPSQKQIFPSYPPARNSSTGLYKELVTDWIRDSNNSNTKQFGSTRPWKSLSDLLANSSTTTGSVFQKTTYQSPTDTTDGPSEYYDIDISGNVTQIEEIYDEMLPQTLSEPNLDVDQPYDLPTEDSSGDDEYTDMAPLPLQALCLETGKPLRRMSRVLGRNVPPHNHTTGSRVEMLKNQLSKLSQASRNTPSSKSQENGPSLSLGAPPSFVPTAPKPNHRIQHPEATRNQAASAPRSQGVKPRPPPTHTIPKKSSLLKISVEDAPPPPPPTNTIPRLGKTKTSDLPPPPPPTNTIPRLRKKVDALPPLPPSVTTIPKENTSDEDIRRSPPNTLLLKNDKDRPDKLFSPLAITPHLPPPKGFSGSSTPATSPATLNVKKPTYPYPLSSSPMTHLPPPILTSPNYSSLDGNTAVPSSPTLPPTPPPFPFPVRKLSPVKSIMQTSDSPSSPISPQTSRSTSSNKSLASPPSPRVLNKPFEKQLNSTSGKPLPGIPSAPTVFFCKFSSSPSPPVSNKTKYPVSTAKVPLPLPGVPNPPPPPPTSPAPPPPPPAFSSKPIPPPPPPVSNKPKQLPSTVKVPLLPPTPPPPPPAGPPPLPSKSFPPPPPPLTNKPVFKQTKQMPKPVAKTNSTGEDFAAELFAKLKSRKNKEQNDDQYSES